ncbi:hypothetical protein [Streptacidiphilus neutrinimicus]|uniref:hypothetical protein n=1 Tax=Streptacidiphilus neutrinimicus TaxID=105420 RepID=UPI0005A60DDE|nr:hypothetical protein [Streptacidiphilus neutrinimicus]
MEDETRQAGTEIRPAVREVYGPTDLGAQPMFAGGFINFGCWRAVDPGGPMGEAERVRSQEALYWRVLDSAGLPGEPGGPEVLEVGRGLGMGCAGACEARVLDYFVVTARRP